MISLRLPKFLEDDLNEFAKIEKKTKTDIVINALMFYFYCFFGFKKPKIKIIKPYIKERKEVIEIVYNISEKIKKRNIKIEYRPGYIFLFAYCGNREIFFSKTRCPAIVKSKPIIKRKNNSLFIVLRKEQNMKRVNIEDRP